MDSTGQRKLAVIIILFLPFLLFYGSAEAGVTYLGEFCIFSNVYQPGPPEPPIQLMKLGVLYYGDGHFVLNGNVPTASTPTPVEGTGLIEGDTFVATLVSSTVNATNTSFMVSHLALKAATEGSPKIADGMMTKMTFDFTQSVAQSKATTVPIYMVVCGP